MGKIYLIDSIWDIVGFIVWSGLAIVGCLALTDEYLKNKNKKNDK